MKTSPHDSDRIDREQLQSEIDLISNNPIIDGLLNVVSGLMAVLNEQRQILAINGAMMADLGIDDPAEVLGLRLGETVQCKYVPEGTDGCGTTPHCASCGAAIAIVVSLDTNTPARRRCTISTVRNQQPCDLYLEVQSYPILYAGKRLLLLFMQDVSSHQNWQALVRVFIHDFNNILTGLVGASSLLLERTSGESHELAHNIRDLSVRMGQEIEMQKHLIDMQESRYKPIKRDVSVQEVLHELEIIFTNHPTAAGKRFVLPDNPPEVEFLSDPSVLFRVIDNLVVNAFEASDPGGDVVVSVKETPGELAFCVWNSGVIPEDITKRLFQRNFSTKPEGGRGLGLFSARLFGEDILDGTLSFTSSRAEGTTFKLVLKI